MSRTRETGRDIGAVNHLLVQVDDLDTTITDLATRGVTAEPPTAPGPGMRTSGRFRLTDLDKSVRARCALRHERMSDYRSGRSTPPAQVRDDGPVVGRVYACDRLAGEQHPLDQHVLVFASGPEEDMVDALVDQLRSGLQ